MLGFVENILRKISSVVYRVVLVIYSFYIIFTFNNFFKVYEYLFAIILYVFLVVLFSTKFNKSPVRLVLDVIIIGLVLYGKDINNLLLISYLYIPIVNSPNHTGNKKSFFTLYILILAIALIVTYPKLCNLIYVPILAYLAIGFMENIRSRFIEFRENLSSVVDESYFKNVQINKTHRVYRDIISVFNKSQFHSSFPLLNIYCLEFKNNKYIIINTSKYVFDISIDQGDQRKLLNDKSVFQSNIRIEVDGSKLDYNLAMKMDYLGRKFIFIFELEKKGTPLFVYIISHMLLNRVFIKVARVLEFEDKLKETELKNSEILKKNMEYIELTRLAMHFLRNKFSPIKTYLQLPDKIKTARTEVIKIKLSNLLEESRPKAISSMDDILTHTDLLLEKYTDFSFRQLSVISLTKLFSMVRRTWDNQIEDGILVFGWNKSSLKDAIEVNEDGMAYVITDLIENIRKYNKSIKRLILDESGDYYVLRFENDYSTDKQVLEKITSEFMSDDILEIEMRRTHGLSMIKRMLIQMKIAYRVYLKDDVFAFELLLKKVPK